MLTRRRFAGYSALSSAYLATPPLVRSALGQTQNGAGGQPLRLAVLGSTYRRGSALQTIADRFLVGYPFEGEWHQPNVKVVSLYVDQRSRRALAQPSDFAMIMNGTGRVPGTPRPRGTPQPGEHPAAPAHVEGAQAAAFDPLMELSEARAEQFSLRLCRDIPEALRCGGDRLAVDAVLAIVEPDDYPRNAKQQMLLPSYDFFQQCAQVFAAEGRAVPYFNHRQLSFSYTEAQSMVATAERLRFPFLAGSSMAMTWRLPEIDVPLGARVQEAVMVGPGSFDGTDFDALEAMQSLLERRKGGETGVKAVQLLEGDDVWAAAAAGRWSHELLRSALSRSDTPLGLTLLDGRTQDLAAPDVLPQLVKDPVAYCIEYSDGTRATFLRLNGAIRDFNIAVSLPEHGFLSTQFYMAVPPNETYSACLASKIEHLFQTGRAPYPVQRALLITGLLEACMTSRHRLNQRIETPHLALRYEAPTDSQYLRT